MKRITTLAAVLALAAPGTAAATSSTCQAYSQQLCAVANADGPTNVAKTTASNSALKASSGTLPFTGLDVALMAVGGGGLLGVGLLGRRFTTRSPL